MTFKHKMMPCPFCGARAQVIQTITRPLEMTTRRVRLCEGKPQHKFETIEFILPENIKVTQ